MNQDNIQLFTELYKLYKTSDSFQKREKQKAITPIFKEIIWETLKHEPFANQQLTDLIQIFKHNCSNDNFDKKLEALVADKKIRTKLSEKAYEIGEPGYTNAGKTAITGLLPNHLKTIKQFLLDAYKITTKQEAINLCIMFDNQQIPQVKKGIYSPWLFYINTIIFPIVNNRHKNLKSWLDLSEDYPTSIDEYHFLKDKVDEIDFSGLDDFAFHLTEDGKLNYRKKYYLNESRLFKISHGAFVKRPDFAQSGIIDILEQNNWISLSRYTGKGAGKSFEQSLRIGDIVYLCYGGDKIICVAKVTSESTAFNEEHAKLLGDKEEEWIYREIEPLYFPIDTNISDLKSFRSQTMPSGNSTFWEIKSSDLETLNNELFIPKFNLEILKDKESEIEDQTDGYSENKPIIQMSKNIILYGPPGTGKTYNSIFHAVSIIDGADLTEAEGFAAVKSRFDNYLMEGRIVFTTFHQSMGYEDFIEGIKPIPPKNDSDPINYRVEDGLFKRLCIEAAFQIAESLNTEAQNTLRGFESCYEHFVADINEKLLNGDPFALDTRNGGTVLVDSISDYGNILIKHDQETRTYTVSKRRLAKLDLAFPDLNLIPNINKAFRAEIGGCNSSAYWAVLNALRNIQPLNIETLPDAYDYETKKELIERLTPSDFATDILKPFVIIIDEINRGNIAQIFGELITLLEEDKRLGKEVALTVTLPYSRERFGVPPNVYIIGTMNTADRSVEALDTALRRRFSFIPKMPEEQKLSITDDGIDLKQMLQAINHRLKVLKDNDHTIGHAWLWSVSNIQQLKTVFANKILPLLQEYFYNDYEKLGLVLGDSFFKLHEQVSSNIFASFTGGNGLVGQYDQSWQYQLKEVHELEVKDFQSLYKNSNTKEL